MIVFQNSGEIDIQALTYMGISVKGKDAIGYFGTGLKFAVATLLRESHSVEIFSGEETYTLGTKPMEFRGRTFSAICLNEKIETNITTELGKDWELWMAFRELASNCLDEGGEYFHVDDGEEILPEAGMTKIIIRGDDFEEIFRNSSEIILDSKPIFSDENCEIHANSSEFIYYKGIRVGKWRKKARYTYNITANLTLTEDRTIKYIWDAESFARDCLIKASADEISSAIFIFAATGGIEFIEHTFNFGNLPVTQKNVNLTEGVQKKYYAYEINPTILTFFFQNRMKFLTEAHSIELAPLHAKMLSDVIETFQLVGIEIGRYPIIFVAALSRDVHGCALDGKIFINVNVFRKGIRELSATLFEEYAHLESGANDCSREFQNYLIETSLRLIQDMTDRAL